jgi:all-trans-retinol dehydrogenase (NAD+)
VAQKLARAGSRVVVWDIDQAGIERVVNELGSIRTGESINVAFRSAKVAALRSANGAEATLNDSVVLSAGSHAGYVCDISQRERVSAVAARVKQEVGPIQIVVSCAGVVSGRPFLELSDTQIERTIQVNTLGLIWVLRAFLPDMVEAGEGHLVTVASAAGLIGVAGLTDYCASKWAAVGLDEALRVELKKQAPRLKTTIVCPYFVNTGMFDGVATRFSWLLPILKEDYVAERIVRGIRRNRRQVLMPWMVHTIAPLRMLPVWLFDTIAKVLGVNAAMDAFCGREGKT